MAPDHSVIHQAGIILILAAAMAGFAMTRWRAEVIAISALAVGALTGIVDAQSIFSGFSDPAVITVIEILMLAQLVAKSGLVDHYARPVLASLTTEAQLNLFLITAGAALSVFMNNIGALAIMMPVAYSGCRRLSISPHRVLMPLSFATLLGGMCSLIGTPANLVVSAARQESFGASLGFFSFAIAGAPAALAGLIWLAASRDLKNSLRGLKASEGQAQRGRDEKILFEVAVSERSEWAGRRLIEIENDEDINILHVLREGQFVFARRDAIKVWVGDILVIAASHDILDKLFDAGLVVPDFDSSTFIQEAVVTPSSVLLGSTIGAVLPFETHDVRVVGIRGANIRADGSFHDIRISLGDVIVLAGDKTSIIASLEGAGCLALAPRRKSAPGALSPISAIVLAGGVGLAAFGIMRTEAAFGIALAVMAIIGGASLPDLLRRLDWGVIIMLAALIPLGTAFERSGAAAAIVQPILLLSDTNEFVIIGAIWAMATVITPFLNNIATAAVMAPIAIAAAKLSGVDSNAALLAVALGASTDFLTPFGHHNNTIVMGAAGYELRDFLRRGAPLTLLVGALGILALAITF